MLLCGPLEIIAKVGAVAYKLKLPATAKIHSVFHVSQLKLFQGENTEPYLPFPLNSTEMGPILMPKTVLKARVIVQGQQHIPQVLILWEDNDPTTATWDNVEEFKRNHPSFFNLEDKISLQGIVMTGKFQGDSAAEVEGQSSHAGKHSCEETKCLAEGVSCGVQIESNHENWVLLIM